MTDKQLAEIGLRIAARRKQLGKTQEQLAEAMDVSIQMVSNLERGNKAIKIENLIRLCAVLDVSADYVLTGKGESGDDPLLTKLSLLPKEDRALFSALLDRLLLPRP